MTLSPDQKMLSTNLSSLDDSKDSKDSVYVVKFAKFEKQDTKIIPTSVATTNDEIYAKRLESKSELPRWRQKRHYGCRYFFVRSLDYTSFIWIVALLLYYCCWISCSGAGVDVLTMLLYALALHASMVLITLSVTSVRFLGHSKNRALIPSFQMIFVSSILLASAMGAFPSPFFCINEGDVTCTDNLHSDGGAWHTNRLDLSCSNLSSYFTRDKYCTDLYDYFVTSNISMDNASSSGSESLTLPPPSPSPSQSSDDAYSYIGDGIYHHACGCNGYYSSFLGDGSCDYEIHSNPNYLYLNYGSVISCNTAACNYDNGDCTSANNECNYDIACIKKRKDAIQSCARGMEREHCARDIACNPNMDREQDQKYKNQYKAPLSGALSTCNIFSTNVFTHVQPADKTLEQCVGWRQTGGCDPNGPREPQNDKTCDEIVGSADSGFCECFDGRKAQLSNCEHEIFSCKEACLFTFLDSDSASNACCSCGGGIDSELLPEVLCTGNVFGCSNWLLRIIAFIATWLIYLVVCYCSPQINALYNPRQLEEVFPELIEHLDKAPSIQIHGEASHTETET